MNNPKIYAVTGASSDVGRVICERLESQGHTVRKISRSEGVSIDDADALAKAFEGADGAYIMIPFDMGAADLHKREDEIGERLATAVQQSGVRRVVLLSAASAHLDGHTGTSMGVARMEKRLEALSIPELVFVRAGFFMENFVNGMSFAEQAQSGVYRGAFKSDRAMPMVASADVGEYIANILSEEPLQHPKVQELLGVRDYTMEEATRILGAAIGKPDTKYEQVPYDAARAGMLSLGVSESFADAVTETARSFNNDDIWAKETRSAQNTTGTTLEQFALETFGTKN